ncbi:MAG: hypothetical protein ISR99_00365 [Parcubacteria group bacterium]|nr:hypothetical protein [Parcubacteria group bacterium]
MDEITKNTNNNEDKAEEEIPLPPLSPPSPRNEDSSLSKNKKPEGGKEDVTEGETPDASLDVATPAIKQATDDAPRPAPDTAPKNIPAKPVDTINSPQPSSTTQTTDAKALEEKKVPAVNEPSFQDEVNKIVPETPTTTPTTTETAPQKLQNTTTLSTPPLSAVAPLKMEAKTTPTIVIPDSSPATAASTPPRVAPATEATVPPVIIGEPTPTTAPTAPKQAPTPPPTASATSPQPLSPEVLIQNAKTRLANEANASAVTSKPASAVEPAKQPAPMPTPSTPIQQPAVASVAPQIPTPTTAPIAPKQTESQTIPTTITPQPLGTLNPPQAPTPTAMPQPAPTAQSTQKLSGIGKTPNTSDTVAPTPAVTVKKSAPFLPNLRTFKGDVSNAMKTKKTSLISIAAAEQNKITSNPVAESKEAGSGKMTKMLVALGGAILILGGISFVAYTFFLRIPSDDVLVERDIPSLIFVNNTQALDISKKSRREIMNGLTFLKDEVGIELGLLEQLVPIFRDSFDAVEVITTKTFLAAIDARVSDALVRSLEPEFTLGVHSFDGNQPFLIFKVKSFRTAFAEMLFWEENMSDDLAPLFGLPLSTFVAKQEATEVVATSTVATPTDESSIELPEIPEKRIFTDVIIKNQDVRVLKDDDGKIAILYTFPNEETIVVTTNENTLSEILTRLGSNRVF